MNSGALTSSGWSACAAPTVATSVGQPTRGAGSWTTTTAGGAITVMTTAGAGEGISARAPSAPHASTVAHETAVRRRGHQNRDATIGTSIGAGATPGRAALLRRAAV